MRIKLGILGIVSLVLGCYKLLPPEAGGRENEIIAILNPYIDSVICDTFEQYFYFPSPDKFFIIRKIKPEEFTRFQYRKNILVIDTLGNPVVDSLLSEEARKWVLDFGGRVFFSHDNFIRNQVVVLCVARNTRTLVKLVNSRKKDLVDYFVGTVFSRIKNKIYKDGIETGVKFILSTKYGIEIDLPRGWQMVKDTVGFVKFIRHFPERVISIYWEDKPRNKWLSEQHAISIRDSIGKKYYYGDYVYKDGYKKFYFVKFKNWAAQKLECVWQSATEDMGGPARTYFFNTKKRFYVIDLHTFAPTETKWLILAQLELIISTFNER